MPNVGSVLTILLITLSYIVFDVWYTRREKRKPLIREMPHPDDCEHTWVAIGGDSERGTVDMCPRCHETRDRRGK